MDIQCIYNGILFSYKAKRVNVKSWLETCPAHTCRENTQVLTCTFTEGKWLCADLRNTCRENTQTEWHLPEGCCYHDHKWPKIGKFIASIWRLMTCWHTEHCVASSDGICEYWGPANADTKAINIKPRVKLIPSKFISTTTTSRNTPNTILGTRFLKWGTQEESCGDISFVL